MYIKIKRLHIDTDTMPTHGSKFSAGWDLKAHIGEPGYVAIDPGEMKSIGTGIAVSIPVGYFGGLYARSGLATNKGLRLTTGTSVIDSDYRGEIMVGLYNDSDQTQYVTHGDRIAQLVIQKHEIVDYWEIVGELDPTERGEGGFGSTGK